ncbi:MULTISPECIES: DUF4232 domain-containing protein [unclassified Streptomyces]|uniref:DUF4232 domain-containing protein n=1 Tax=unclassified Streptomyces TaxID=2593676 RepID=UPI000F4DDF8E|nr:MULTISPECIES: DUF4232 domain-containing protein [unclassified Streptomyces]MDH6455006.1 hypothetical protein [Streptomyces sp. SAI-119]MDH6494440.1 hypothetical protein [Streptomyces sp. SAI-149]QUC58411.1 DUF4232 domain-containing protein [Streptomyces sp. A2-16]GLP69492.1 lipoprotein [Streptomyces sp. TUS-ST3]
MTNWSLGVRRSVLLAGSAALLGLLAGCGSGDGTASGPRTESGTAAPTTGSTTGSPRGDGTGSAPSGVPTDAVSNSLTPSAAGTRCHTSELSASVGRNNPGAGQENFPVVLTNESSRTCTLYGYPGTAFVDASGHQLGPDPKRSSGEPETVKLAPGQSAWAGLSFANPEVSGAGTATPAALLVTPPDEEDPLKVTWTSGEVPVSGDEASVRLIPFSPGTGA